MKTLRIEVNLSRYQKQNILSQFIGDQNLPQTICILLFPIELKLITSRKERFTQAFVTLGTMDVNCMKGLEDKPEKCLYNRSVFSFQSTFQALLIILDIFRVVLYFINRNNSLFIHLFLIFIFYHHTSPSIAKQGSVAKES